MKFKLGNIAKLPNYKIRNENSVISTLTIEDIMDSIALIIDLIVVALGQNEFSFVLPERPV